jgi:transposase
VQPSGEDRLAVSELIGLVGIGANTVFAPMQETVQCNGKRRSIGRSGASAWSIEQKQSIVAAAFEPGAVVREVARRCDVTASLIYRWRRDLRAAPNGFARVVVAPAGDGIAAALAMPAMPAIEIEFPGDAPVRIPASVSPALAAAVVAALAQR